MLSLYTSPAQPPGISSIGVSFAQPPSLDFNFHTFALVFRDLPFLLGMLKVGTADSKYLKLQMSIHRMSVRPSSRTMGRF